jgi:hypothetical protein
MRQHRSRIALGILVGCFGFLLSPMTFEAREAQGHSAAAKRCKQEWRDLRTLDGQSFKNVGQCVSYAARGGEFAVVDASPAAACDRLGGVATTERRNGVDVTICSGFGGYTQEIQETFEGLCGVVTTETRGGEPVVICTPSGPR